ncbi:MAG TPA: 6,7-dimethyl-8-ribityllumazine synthase [Gemmatimonadaceae bacterium]|nr:6,7-dimethyl-8-ribityllumazine synthase [Gemmatimonadaceae bacterium]
MKIVIIAAEFNRAVVDPMIEVASNEARAAKCKVDLVRVPGTYEIPLPASIVIAKRNVDAVVVLGYIERGETLHGEVMGKVVTDALVRLSIEHRKPIGIGIIGPGATEEQAHKRKEGHARAAVHAALAAMATARALAKR